MMKVICSKHWEISPTNHPHLISPSFQQASLQYWTWIIILYLVWIHQTDPTSCKTTINRFQFASYLSIQELHPKRYIRTKHVDKNRMWTESISCSPHPWFLCLPLILSLSCHSSHLTNPWCCWSEWVSWCSWHEECLSSLQWSLHHLLLFFPLLPHLPLRSPTRCSRTGIQMCSVGWTRWRIFLTVVETEDSLLGFRPARNLQMQNFK